MAPERFGLETGGRAEALRQAALLLASLAIFLVAHRYYPGVPQAGNEMTGWGGWADQTKYIVASQAWSAFDLTPLKHWYPPGYPLLAAFLLPLTSPDRFLLPNIACLIAGQLACGSLAVRLFPGLRLARSLGAAVFLVASVGTLVGLKTWIAPWTTTPAAAITLMALVAALRLAEQPSGARGAVLGALVGAMLWFRPADAMPIALASAVVLLQPLRMTGPARLATVVLCGLLGTLAAAVPLYGLIAATTGFGNGTYFALSRNFGFEIRLLPLRFVTLILDGRPVFDGVGTERFEPGLHRGLEAGFPWVIPGLVGAVTCLFGAVPRRAVLLLGAWLTAQMVLILSYRDLHVLGFWQYANYHYFKAAQPILLLFALSLPIGFWNGTLRLPAAGIAVLAFVGLTFWRIELLPDPGHAPGPNTDAAGLALGDLSSIDSAAIVPARGTWNRLYADPFVLAIGARRYVHNFDFKIYARKDDLLLVPIRPLAAGAGVLFLDPGMADEPHRAVVMMRQHLHFGLPCLFGIAGAAVCGTLGAPVIPVAAP